MDLGTESDHKMIKTELIIQEKVREEQFNATKNASLAGMIDFNSTDDEKFKAALKETEWAKVINGVEPGQMAAAYVEAVCQAALKANAARHDSMATKRKREREDEVKAAAKERLKLLRQNEKKDVRQDTKLQNSKRLEVLNSKLNSSREL